MNNLREFLVSIHTVFILFCNCHINIVIFEAVICSVSKFTSFTRDIIYGQYNLTQEPGSSGSIVSDYGLVDRAIGVGSPAGAKDFSSIICVQTGSGAHPSSCTAGTGDPFPRGKARPGHDPDHSPPSSVEVGNEYELYLLSPQAPSWNVAGQLYFTYHLTCQ
jgi:hypothetical protein